MTHPASATRRIPRKNPFILRDSHGCLQANILAVLREIGVIIPALMDRECLLPLQIGTADAAYQSLSQHQAAVLDWGQHRDSRAELPRRCQAGQLEVKRADLHATYTIYGLVFAHNGDTQQHDGFPGVF